MNKSGLLLDRLEGVRRTGDGKWMCRCPAHGDRSPSLAVRETADGRVLVHCFAGCPVDAVLDAVGMDIQDLFPDKTGRGWDASQPRPRPTRINASDLIQLAAFESRVVAIAADRQALGETATDADLARLMEAADTLTRIAEEVAYG